LLVPIGILLITHYSKFYTGGLVYIIAIVLYKAAVAISVMAVAWKHVGLCYIPYGMRVNIIIMNCAEICVLVVEAILLWRIKKVKREILV
jgi:uncharacterized membrane protein